MKRRRPAGKRREQRAEANWGPKTAPCPTPTKVSYPTKHHAKVDIRRKLRVFAETKSRHNAARDNDRARPGSLPRAYRCPCGQWHIGHLPLAVRSGSAHRSDIVGAAA